MHHMFGISAITALSANTLSTVTSNITGKGKPVRSYHKATGMMTDI
jgi:hypothetical protein